MNHHSPHNHVKRLQHDANSDLRSAAHQPSSTRTNSTGHRSSFPNVDAVRESIQNLTIPASQSTKHSRPVCCQDLSYRPEFFWFQFQPGPQQARRGASRANDRGRYSSVSLPKRAINYDLAESFIDHSTNPLLSDLYQKKFKHSSLQWPQGRFVSYKDKLIKTDGTSIDITCARTLPITYRKKAPTKVPTTTTTTTTERNEQIYDEQNITTNSLDPIAQQLKKQQIEKQMDIYASLYGNARIQRVRKNRFRSRCSNMSSPLK